MLASVAKAASEMAIIISFFIRGVLLQALIGAAAFVW